MTVSKILIFQDDISKGEKKTIMWKFKKEARLKQKKSFFADFKEWEELKACEKSIGKLPMNKKFVKIIKNKEWNMILK